MAVFSLEAVNYLQKLWLSPIVVIPQVGRRPRLIIDFTWSGINDIAECLAPMEAMCFGGALLLILKQVLTADPRLGTLYLSKVDLADTYMRLWARMEDVQSVAFLIPKKTPRDTHLVGFHLSIPMGYIDNAPYYCMAMETLTNIANEAIFQREHAGEHTLHLESKYRAANDAGAPEA